MMRYPIAIEMGTDSTAFGIVVPDLPGCFSAGDTLDEALANAEEAIRLFLEEMVNAGIPLPSRPPWKLSEARQSLLAGLGQR